MGTSSLITVTGGTCQRLGAVTPWRKVDYLIDNSIYVCYDNTKITGFLKEKHMTYRLQMCMKIYLWINYGFSDSFIMAVIKAFGNKKGGKEKTDET